MYGSSGFQKAAPNGFKRKIFQLSKNENHEDLLKLKKLYLLNNYFFLNVFTGLINFTERLILSQVIV